MTHIDYDIWSRPKQNGYDAYYDNCDEGDNPYSYCEEEWQWEQWCDGHMMAYCEDEGK